MPQKRSNRAAVIPAKGIGDALLMMIAASTLRLAGYETTIFHDKIGELSSWFKGGRFEKKELFCAKEYGRIVVQNDNSPLIASLIQEARERLSIFYPTYHSYKHAPLGTEDKVFDSRLPMADNIAKAINASSKDNGLTPPAHLTRRLYKKRIVLHPTSSLASKNWTPSKFLTTAALLQEKGYDPVFVMAAHEEKRWGDFAVQPFSHLDALAAFLFESGGLVGNDSLLGHLASNLGLPTLIVADNPHLMRLWRPGWMPGAILTPPSYLPHRLRLRFWRALISPKKVANYFHASYGGRYEQK